MRHSLLGSGCRCIGHRHLTHRENLYDVALDTIRCKTIVNPESIYDHVYLQTLAIPCFHRAQR